MTIQHPKNCENRQTETLPLIPRIEPDPDRQYHPKMPPVWLPQSMKRKEPVGWFVKTKNGEVGPLHIIQIAKAVGQGRIGPGTELRHNGRGITVFACCVPGLFPPSVYNPLLEQMQREEQQLSSSLERYLRNLMSESLQALDDMEEDENLTPRERLVRALFESRRAKIAAA